MFLPVYLCFFQWVIYILLKGFHYLHEIVFCNTFLIFMSVVVFRTCCGGRTRFWRCRHILASVAYCSYLCLSPSGYSWCLLVWVTLSGSCCFCPLVASVLLVSSSPDYSIPPVGPSDCGVLRSCREAALGRPSDCWIFRGTIMLSSCVKLFSRGA